jgi:hypothetical protein
MADIFLCLRSIVISGTLENLGEKTKTFLTLGSFGNAIRELLEESIAARSYGYGWRDKNSFWPVA